MSPLNSSTIVLQSCLSCKELKPIAEFHFRNDRKVYYTNCRSCVGLKHREYYQRTKTNPGYIQRMKKYNKSHDKEFYNSVYYRMRGTSEFKARDAVRKAVRYGKIIRQPCKICFKPLGHFHHTNGYDKANYFVGTWLCPKHHMAEHVRLREKNNSYV